MVSHPVPSHLNLDYVFKELSRLVPKHLFRGLDSIYVGQFSFLADRELNAMYKDGALFLTNEQDNESDMLDDLVHEVAHLVEDENRALIYSDKQVEREFLSKRRSLYHTLEEDKEMFQSYYPNYADFINPNYDRQFDAFLYKVIGYDNLAIITANLFYSPYGATSLREYFANGFEAYFFHRDASRVKSISPFLYKKITDLEVLDEN